MRLHLTGVKPTRAAAVNITFMVLDGVPQIHVLDRPSLNALVMALTELQTLHDAQGRVDAALKGEVK